MRRDELHVGQLRRSGPQCYVIVKLDGEWADIILVDNSQISGRPLRFWRSSSCNSELLAEGPHNEV